MLEVIIVINQLKSIIMRVSHATLLETVALKRSVVGCWLLIGLIGLVVVDGVDLNS